MTRHTLAAAAVLLGAVTASVVTGDVHAQRAQRELAVRSKQFAIPPMESECPRRPAMQRCRYFSRVANRSPSAQISSISSVSPANCCRRVTDHGFV
jgi:hypothetical protein